MRQRILFASALEAAPWGAAEELWYRTVLAAVGEDAEVEPVVSVRAWPEDPSPVRRLEDLGVEVHRRSPEQDPEDQARELLDRIRPDLVLVSQPDVFSAVPWMNACRRQAQRYAVVTHYTSETEWPSDRIFADLAAGFREAVRSFFVSEAGLRLTERQIAERIVRAEVVRCPFKVPYGDPPPWPSDGTGLRWACVARLDPEDKGQDLLMEVLASERWRQRPVVLTLFGDGPNRRSLEALRDFWGLGSIRFGGYVRDLQQMWRQHHALVLASRAEGLPAVIVEAMLSARPCVVTDVGGNAELLEDGRTGFVAPFPRVGPLDEALERLWRERDRLEEMGRLAREAVLRRIPPDPPAVFRETLISLLPGGA